MFDFFISTTQDFLICVETEMFSFKIPIIMS